MASILVVDDEPTIRQLLGVTVGTEHRVEEAANGAEALKRMLATPPDVVLLDVAMPIMDGLAVCRAARAEPALAGVGIIIVSVLADAHDALAAGADCHFSKPFRPLELLKAIEHLLLRRKGPRQFRGTSEAIRAGIH